MALFSPVMKYFWEGAWRGGHVEPLRRIYESELVYVSRGEFHLDVAGHRHLMRAGSVAIIPPGVWHESRVDGRRRTYRHCIHFDWMHGGPPDPRPLQSFAGEPFDPHRVNPVPPDVSPFLPLVAHLKRQGEAVRILRQALGHIRCQESMGVYLLWPVIQSLLTAQEHAGAGPAFPGKTARAVLLVRDFIDRHYAEPQGYQRYQELTGITGSHLCQAFRAMIGRPPTTYLIDLRLHHACRLMRESAMNIAEVGYAVGFPDANYFSRLFRRKFGQTPTQFITQAAAGRDFPGMATPGVATGKELTSVLRVGYRDPAVGKQARGRRRAARGMGSPGK